jgi:hypothetical protein
MLGLAAIGVAFIYRNIASKDTTQATQAAEQVTQDDIDAAKNQLLICQTEFSAVQPPQDTTASQIESIKSQILNVQNQIETARKVVPAAPAVVPGSCTDLMNTLKSVKDALDDETTSLPAMAEQLRQAAVPALTKKLQCEQLLQRIAGACPSIQRNDLAWSDLPLDTVKTLVEKDASAKAPEGTPCGYWGIKNADGTCVIDTSKLTCPSGMTPYGTASCCPTALVNGKCPNGCTLDYSQNMPFCAIN